MVGDQRWKQDGKEDGGDQSVDLRGDRQREGEGGQGAKEAALEELVEDRGSQVLREGSAQEGDEGQGQ